MPETVERRECLVSLNISFQLVLQCQRLFSRNTIESIVLFLLRERMISYILALCDPAKDWTICDSYT